MPPAHEKSVRVCIVAFEQKSSRSRVCFCSYIVYKVSRQNGKEDIYLSQSVLCLQSPKVYKSQYQFRAKTTMLSIRFIVKFIVLNIPYQFNVN